jgi:hypothetical protein
MAAELWIVADVSLEQDDATVQTADGSVLGVEAEVPAGSKLTVTVSAFDYERLPISRPGLQIAMRLTMGDTTKPLFKGAASLVHLAGNKYRAEVPGTWLVDAGSYHLAITSSTNSGATLKFTVSSSRQSLYIALGISSVRPCTPEPRWTFPRERLWVYGRGHVGSAGRSARRAAALPTLWRCYGSYSC